MPIRVISVLIIFFSIYISNSCKCYKQAGCNPFILNEAYYQSWIESAQNKGTNLIIKLTDVDGAVVFDSLIFRGLKVPVFVTIRKDTTIIAGLIPIQGANTPIKGQTMGEPDQLLYKLNGIRHNFYLKRVKRLNMNYFNKK